MAVRLGKDALLLAYVPENASEILGVGFRSAFNGRIDMAIVFHELLLPEHFRHSHTAGPNRSKVIV